VPFKEARALEGLGRAHLQDGNTGQAAAHLGRRSASTSARDLPGLRAFRTHFATAVCDGEARSHRRRAPRSPDQVIGEPDSAHNWADLATRAPENEASITRAVLSDLISRQPDGIGSMAVTRKARKAYVTIPVHA
jgi:hypothetical protein